MIMKKKRNKKNKTEFSPKTYIGINATMLYLHVFIHMYITNHFKTYSLHLI